MLCPICKKHTMSPVELAPELTGMACSGCSGIWLDRNKYDTWRAKQPQDLPEISTPVQTVITETHKAKICPQCGHLLLPYRVGHGLSFSIDYCGSCSGVWFDRNEWDAIKAKNLHDNLHVIVSQHWQAAGRQSGIQEAVEKSYSRQLGTDYAKAQEVKAWLRNHPQKGLILAYLTDINQEGK